MSVVPTIDPANTIKHMRIKTGAFNTIQACLREALDEAGTTATPSCKHIVGRSRTGRSFALQCFESEFPVRREAHGLRKEVIYVQTPSDGTVKGLMSEILCALGDPKYNSGTAQNMLARLRLQLDAVGCRLIILDEFQHLVDKGQRRKLGATIDWLKLLVERARFSLVAVGLPDSVTIIDRDEQLRNRFDTTIEIPIYTWFDKESRRQFRALLGTIKRHIEPFETVDLVEPDIAQRMMLAASGRIGLIARIFDRAIKTAVSNETRTIRLEDLDAAYRLAVRNSARCTVEGGPFFAALTDHNVRTLWAQLSDAADLGDIDAAHCGSLSSASGAAALETKKSANPTRTTSTRPKTRKAHDLEMGRALG
ncbi:TniB family NTP-binding protein [Luteimonas sp. SMYT11W]|uniref:TniB family NTP-binding protein n=1 Tax=Luteimonas flava TaxID=3115822 RepID=A0ABU7WDP3_9GAMM